MREFCGTGRCIITCTFGISKKFDCSCLLWLSVTISTLLARHRWAKMTFNKPFYSLLLLWLGPVSFVVYFPEADWLEEILKWMNNHRTSKRQVSTFNRLAKEIQIPVLLSMTYSIAPVTDMHWSMTHLKETSSFSNHWFQKNSYIILTSLSSSTPTKYLKILWYWLVKP